MKRRSATEFLLGTLDGAALLFFALALLMGFFSYGGVTERGAAALALFGLMGALLVGLRLAASLLLGRDSRLAFLPAAPVILWLVFMLWAALQLVPLTEGTVRILSPSTAQWHETFSQLGPLFTPRLTLDPAATERALVQLLFLTLAGLAAAQYAAAPRRRDRLALLLLGASAFAVIYGFLELAGIVGDARGWRQISGPLINRNHFATLMIVSTPLGAGWALTIAWRRARRSHRDGRHFDWRHALNSNLVLLLLLPVIFGVACLATLSRSGIAACGVALLSWLAFVGRRGGARLAAGLCAAVLLGVTLLLAASGLDPLTRRFGRVSEALDVQAAYSRGQIWGDSWLIAADFPVTGTGLGSFYGMYMPYSSADTTRLPIHAHSEWLQVFVEAGFVGLLLVACAAALFLWRAARRMMREARSTELPLLAGAWAGAAGVMVQCLVEFPLRIPVIALFLALTLGLVLGSTERSRSNGRRRAPVPS